MSEPKLIRTWNELAECTSRTHYLKIEVHSGWIYSNDNQEYHYLSTHTFYGSTHKRMTALLQSCGFNVVLANWDETDSENLVDKLTRLWLLCDTRDLSSFFEAYMIEIGVRKVDRRRKDNTNTYLIYGESENWNRVQCYYQKDSEKSREEDLLLTLRKRAGNYFIIERKGIRAFEVDYSGLRHHDEVLLNEIMHDHKPLFDKLFLALGVN